MKHRNRNISSVIEAILLLTTITITAIPAFFCVGMISDIVRFDLKADWLRSVFTLVIMIAGVLGFFSFVLRLIGIFTRSTAKIITTGLIVGLCVYLSVLYIPLLIDLKLRDVKLSLLYLYSCNNNDCEP